MNKFTVARDSREQKGNGWWFEESDRCAGTIVKTLQTGDYTIEGYESLLCIERKASTGEFAKNITEARFDRELERMESFRYPFVILEFSLRDIINFPKNSGIPQHKWSEIKIKPQFMLKRLVEYQVKYKSKIIFADYYGAQMAESIFKRIVDASA